MGLTALWISQPFVLGRIYPGLTALWITLRYGLEEWGEVGAGFAPTPLRQD